MTGRGSAATALAHSHRADVSPSWPPPARPTPGSSTTWPASPTSPRSGPSGSTSTGRTECAALFVAPVRHRFDGIERADSFVVDPHKWLFAPVRLRRAHLPQSSARQGGAHPGRLLPRRAPPGFRRSGTRATTPTTSPAGHGDSPSGSRSPSTAPTPTATPSRRPWRGARRRRPASTPPPTSSSSGSPGCRSCCSVGPGWAPADYDRWSEELLHDQIGFVTATTWEGEPSPGSPSSIRTPPSRWSTRSWRP